MLIIAFEGWFQCRLATDPDSWDEPRGVSGWTFAFPGEPNLDRIIRFQNPVALRSYGPDIGVRITSVSLDGMQVLAHPLTGGSVDLLDSPVFEGQNGLIAESAHEPISPFRVQFSGNGVTIGRADPIDLTKPAEVVR